MSSSPHPSNVMTIPWRTAIGPLITLAIAGLILLADRHLVRVPNPGAISFLAVAFAAYLGGIASGLVSAAISLALAVVLFSLPGELFHFTPDNLLRLVVLSICTPAIAVMIGVLQRRTQRATEHEHAANKELTTLRSALDQSEVGVLLLDSEMRAQFMNRTFRRLWRLSDDDATRKPAFVGLMYHGRNAKTFLVPANQLDAYIADETARVRAGHETPVDIRLASGDVVRSRCKILADGGRMLTYGNVSDLVRSADEMAELAKRDPLTGIYNRRHFVTRLDSEWKRFRRYGRPLSVMLVDIDHFKSINDRYGHAVGDQVIAAIARLCREQTRDSDLVARIGGEEFAILLPETELEDAHVVAERLRVTVKDLPITGSDGSLSASVTASIGIVLADAAFTDSAELMKHADEALYAAKHAGRNCVAAWVDGAPSVFDRQARTAA